MQTNVLLRLLALLCDEAAAGLDSGGVPTLVLNTFVEAAMPIWLQIGITAKTANTPHSGKTAEAVKTAQGPAGAKPLLTVLTVRPAAKSAPADTPAPVLAKNKAVVSVPESKTVTLNPPRRGKMAGM